MTIVLATVYDSLDVLSVFIIAACGASLAVQRELPLPLVMLSGLVTGLGGGFVRDLIIGAPPVALYRPDYIAAAFAAVAVVAFSHTYMSRYKGTLEIVQTLALALFCMTGTIKVVDYGYGPAFAVPLGLFSAVGGGILRDALMGRFPDFLRRDRMPFAAALVALAGTTTGLLMFHDIDQVSRAAILLAAVAALLLATRHYRKKITGPLFTSWRRRAVSG